MSITPFTQITHIYNHPHPYRVLKDQQKKYTYSKCIMYQCRNTNNLFCKTPGCHGSVIIFFEQSCRLSSKCCDLVALY